MEDDEKVIHPNDDVNKSQSSNDTFPTTLTCYKIIVETTIPGVKKLRNTLAKKSEEFMKVVKIGRTHLMDVLHLHWVRNFLDMYLNLIMD